MTPDDMLFSRAILGSVVAFALVATVHFLLPARVGAVVRKFHPAIGVACIGVALAFDLPLVAKVLLWLLAVRYVLLHVAFVILSPLLTPLWTRKRRTKASSTVR